MRLSAVVAGLSLLLASSAVADPPSATPLSEPGSAVSGLALNASKGEVAWDVLTESGRSARFRSLTKKGKARTVGSGVTRGMQWTAGKPMVNQLNDGRWSIRIGGKEPASPSAASDLHGAVSPDGRRVAFVSGRSGQGDIYLAATNKSNQSPTRLVGSPGPELMPVWSPDGKHLAFLRVTERGRQAVFVPVAGGAAGDERVIAEERDEPVAVSWRPDGKQLAFFSRDWTVGTSVFTVTAAFGPASKLVGDVRAHPSGPAWLPDGKGGWLLVLIRKDDAIIAVNAIGETTVLQTGTFGHTELVAGTVKGRRTLVFTALGLDTPAPRATDEPFAHHRAWTWTLP